MEILKMGRATEDSAKKSKKAASFLSGAAAVLIAALVISASVTATLFDRGAYNRLQDRLGLPESVGISEVELLDNYNALIDYNSVFYTGLLSFPTFPMSEAGRIHFEEVKVIFSFFQITLIVSAALTALCCFLLIKKRCHRFLASGGILSLVIPAVVVSIMAAFGWDRFFIMFHEVFFNNDFWVFDARTDPVILILPDAFFLNCLLRIVIGIAITAILLIWGSNQRTLDFFRKFIKKNSLKY